MSSRKLQDAATDKERENRPILFPAGLKFSYTFNDPDEMSGYGTKWRQEYLQLTLGSFEGRMQAAHTRSLQIGRVTWSPSILITGDIPEKCVAIAVSVSKSSPPVFHNEPLHTAELAILSDGDEIDFLSNNPQEILVLSIDKELINRYSMALLGKEVNAVNTYHNRLRIKDESARKELVNLWSQTLNLSLSSDENLQDGEFANKIEEDLISYILCSSGSSSYHATRVIRHHAAKLARQYIIENKKKQMSILDICEAVDATERTLHLGFQELYGLTPKAFLKYLRLNYARRELLRSKPGCTVTRVAYKWKFYHLSRFARAYYEVFNEYPSETLNRSTASNHSSIDKSQL